MTPALEDQALAWLTHPNLAPSAFGALGRFGGARSVDALVTYVLDRRFLSSRAAACVGPRLDVAAAQRLAADARTDEPGAEHFLVAIARSEPAVRAEFASFARALLPDHLNEELRRREPRRYDSMLRALELAPEFADEELLERLREARGD